MKKVLLVDDNREVARMVTRRLKKAGYDVCLACDGRAGISMALEENPTLILMDMDMPVLDGYSATRHLRHLGFGGIIVALTAAAMVEDREKAMESGCDDYIAKPIDQGFEKDLHRILSQREKEPHT